MCFCCGYWKIESLKEEDLKVEAEQPTESMKPQYEELAQ